MLNGKAVTYVYCLRYWREPLLEELYTHRGIFFAFHHVGRIEQVSVGATMNLVDYRGLQVDKK